MPDRTQVLKLPYSTMDLKPVPREEVEAYLEAFMKVADPLQSDGENDKTDRMDWDAWRALRQDDYFIQWNIHQSGFRISREEYLERWKWTPRTGRGWETMDAKVHIIETGFIVEAILRSTHKDEKGEHIVLNLCETYHIQDGKAVCSNEYIDPTDLRRTESDIPGGW